MKKKKNQLTSLKLYTCPLNTGRGLVDDAMGLRVYSGSTLSAQWVVKV